MIDFLNRPGRVALGLLTLTTVGAAVLSMQPARADAELPPAATKEVDFVKDVRPLLEKHCVECHGAKKQEAGLRLDRKAGPLGDSGKAIVSGKSEESLVVLYAAGVDSDNVMPPDGKKLTDAEIGLLRAWIDGGAKRPDDGADAAVRSTHWSYQPVKRPAVPQTSRPEWVRNAIDAFVLARLDAAKIVPSPEADRATLLRRVHLDLIGLPPSPAETDAFLRDDSSDAYERLVDRLLASPRFGERWGRHWLDMARYADSDGYEKDNPRLTAYKYRDWVIDAVNRDLPYDRFTIEQLAGDLLPDATHDQHIATAFHRQTLTNTEGGTDQEQFRHEACFDRVATTGAVWLAMTIGCAQCHSHKYEPISQSEYYRFFAFFNNGDETTRDVPISADAVTDYEKNRAAHEASLQPLAAKRAALRQSAAATQKDWEPALQSTLAAARKTPLVWHALDVVAVTAENGSTFAKLDDGSWFVSGESPDIDVYTVVAKAPAAEITGLKLDVLADDRLPGKGPGRNTGGNFVLEEITLAASDDETFPDASRLTFNRAAADFTQKEFAPEAVLDGKPKTGWAVAGQTAKNHTLTLRVASGAEGSMSRKLDPAKTRLRIVLTQKYGGHHTLGRFKLSASTGVDVNDVLPDAIVKALDVPADKRTDAQRTTLLDHRIAQDAAGKALLEQIAQTEKAAPVPPLMKAAVITQRAANPRATKILRRGDFLQPQAEVQPGTFEILHAFRPRADGKPGDRLDLARWLVDPANPLTPRVAVNQVWYRLFGRGLVPTITDFGVRGEAPSHPELLDWLAAEFRGGGAPVEDRGRGAEGQGATVDGVSEGVDRAGKKPGANESSPAAPLPPGPPAPAAWSRKAIIKLIVTSSTYRQSSAHRPDVATVDPYNALLHRQARLRVEAEIIRDIHLATAGLLSHKLGGPSVFPPLPADVAALSYANNFRWTNSTGEDRYRRGLYTFFKRTAPYPNLTAFDCPDGVTTSPARSPSNTPIQALATLNNEVFVETAQALAARLLTEVEPGAAASDDARVARAFRIALSREPSLLERDGFVKLVTQAREHYATQPEEAAKLTSAHRPATVAAHEAAAWVVAARVLLNLDEFVTRE